MEHFTPGEKDGKDVLCMEVTENTAQAKQGDWDALSYSITEHNVLRK